MWPGQQPTLELRWRKPTQGKCRELPNCRQQGLAFVPLAMEALGGLHKVTVAQVKMLAAALARHTGQEEGEAKRHLFQRLSLGLMRGNATMLVCRGPDGDHPAGEVDGIAKIPRCRFDLIYPFSLFSPQQDVINIFTMGTL